MDEVPEHQIAKRVLYYLKHVDKRGPDECWPWLSKNPAAVPRMHWYQSIKKRTSHVAYWLEHGEWPSYVEHTCDNMRCNNPAHLLDTNHAANMQSMAERERHANTQKTHCPANHPYAVYARIGTRANGSTFRVCKACERERTWKKRGARREGTPGKPRLRSATQETDIPVVA